MLVSKTHLPWNNNNILWGNNPYTWEEVVLSQELAVVLGRGSKELEHWLAKDKTRKKKVIQLICKVKNNVYKETKTFDQNIKITIKDIELVINEVTKVSIKVKVGEN